MKEEQKKDKNINEIEELRAKCEEYLTGWKRERADFLNYKKDEMEKIGQLIKYANKELILKFLPILDNFYLAEKHIPENKEFTDGFLQIKKQLKDFLQKEGVEEIKTLGKKFDPNTMEAVSEAEGGDKGTIVEKVSGDPATAESGLVIEEIQRGYTLRGKVIRPAKVKVIKQD